MKTFTLYDENTINSDNTRVLLAGLKLDRFKKNPVMLYMHNRGEHSIMANGSEVIGRWDNIRIEGSKLLADAVFDESDEFSEKIANKVKDNFLRAASVGVDVIMSSDELEYKIEGQTGSTVISSVLVEASIVDIPKNEDSLVKQCYMYASNSRELNHKTSRLHHAAQPKMAKQSAQAERELYAKQKEKETYSHLTQEINTLKKSLHQAEQWKKNFLEKQRNELLENAAQEGIIDHSQRDYYYQLLKKDYDLGRKMIMSQYEKWKQQGGSNTPKLLFDFVNGLKGRHVSPAQSTVSLSAAQSKAPQEEKAYYKGESSYEYMLKHNPAELKMLREKSPNKFKDLLEAHLTWKEQTK